MARPAERDDSPAENSPVEALRVPELTAGGHRTLAEQAFARLHQAIVTGALAPGLRLPIEDLATSMNMSPMPVREALRRLDAAGLVENVPHRGARVTDLSLKDLHEVYEARLALEPLTVRRAAARFTEDDHSEVRRLLDEHADATQGGDPVRIWSTHTAFHFGLYDAAGSRWLLRLIRPLWESSERYRYATIGVQAKLDRRRREHEAILAACAANDAEGAAVRLHNHLVHTANSVAHEMGSAELFEVSPEPTLRLESDVRTARAAPTTSNR